MSPSHPPDMMRDAVGPTPELDRKNMRLGFAFVALFLLMFAGTFAIAYIYLWLD
jgi:hypothetical protein